MAANQRNGAHAQAQTSVQTKHGCQCGAQNVLEQNQHDSNCQEDDNLNAAGLQQTEAGSEADRAEEHGHEESLEGVVEGDVTNTGGVADQVNDCEHQAAHNRCGDAVGVQEVDLAAQEAAQQQHDCCNGNCLISSEFEGCNFHKNVFLLAFRIGAAQAGRARSVCLQYSYRIQISTKNYKKIICAFVTL